MPSRENVKHSFKLVVVCGDGLPVSGLLTTFRNVVDMIKETSGCPQLIDLPIPVDLGYSWRPDKAAFFPQGPKEACYPLLDREALHQSIEAISVSYQQHFEAWFEAEDADWRWGNGQDGGVLFWDHDLLKSYAVHEDSKRIYPPSPNEFTAGAAGRSVARLGEYHHRLPPSYWNTWGRPQWSSSPAVSRPDLSRQRDRDFHPPLATIQSACHKRNLPAPYLLIFGDPEEDPRYAAALKTLADDLNVSDDVHFIGGVPICSGVYREVSQLDEKDLAACSPRRRTGVSSFNPCTKDVESVGLGPALASIAGDSSQQGLDIAAEELIDLLSHPPSDCEHMRKRGKDWLRRLAITRH
ncbi:hypothetical protein B0H14DRAFT_3615184 [Mycena olivaceomarginata]|nr:hypothetical protein B0H14DRAFT_3615184 [Mycena olivaceomarginata]